MRSGKAFFPGPYYFSSLIFNYSGVGANIGQPYIFQLIILIVIVIE